MDQGIVIVGAGGRLGQALASTPMGQQAAGALDRRALDLERPGEAERVLDTLSFDTLLLAAAHTQVDRCESEPDRAQRINAEAPGEIARLCAERGAKLVFFSTDYVFDGQRREPYREGDAPSPQSVYGRSKLAGEEAVLAASSDHLIVRLAWLFGPGRGGATPDWVVEGAVAGRALRIVEDKVGSPSYSPDIATAVADLMENHRDRACGVLHLSNAGACTWREWAEWSLACAEEGGLVDAVPELEGWTLDECFAGKAPRPAYSALDCSLFASIVGAPLRDWREAVRQYVLEELAPQLRESGASK